VAAACGRDAGAAEVDDASEQRWSASDAEAEAEHGRDAGGAGARLTSVLIGPAAVGMTRAERGRGADGGAAGSMRSGSGSGSGEHTDVSGQLVAVVSGYPL
jgi:hypothetical protein